MGLWPGTQGTRSRVTVERQGEKESKTKLALKLHYSIPPPHALIAEDPEQESGRVTSILSSVDWNYCL